MKEFKIPLGYGKAEFIEKRSRFIGRVWHTQTEDKALSRIREMREKHWDATHNVYAYIIKSGGIMRFSDDGEPQGTSGIPVLNVFRSGEIFDCCCVVTRYFGGTLLGAGGLVRAYSHTAKLALDAAETGVMSPWSRSLISCTYSQFERVRGEIEVLGGIIENTDFGSDIAIECIIPEIKQEKLENSLTDLSAGTITVLNEGTEMRATKNL